MELLNRLREEKACRRKGGLYHQTQILFAYNSNRIEGSRLTQEQTRYIYETNTFLPQSENEIIHTDDILETLNHFRAFDYLLDIADQPLSEDIMKRFHAILKQGTADDRNPEVMVGGYKTLPNMIGASVQTVAPEDVSSEIKGLLNSYHGKPVDERGLIDFHYKFEKIHPFQDGNGRVGRLILFKEALYHNLVPFVIDSDHKLFYYRGLKEYAREPGYLVDTCLSAQDHYRSLLQYFRIDSQPALSLDAQVNGAEVRQAAQSTEKHKHQEKNEPER